MSETDAEEKSAREEQEALEVFMEELDVDEDIARVLVNEGFTSVEEIAYVELEELLQISVFDEEIVEELRGRARDVVLTRAIAAEEQIGDAGSDQSLMAVEGMTDELCDALIAKDIKTRDDLADLATDELVELIAIDEESAAALIMSARAAWFEEMAEEEGE